MFARNKSFLKHKNRSRYETGNPNISTLQHFNVQVSNILKQCNDNPNDVQKKMIRTALKNVAYYANHSLFNSTKGMVYNRALNRSIKLAKRAKVPEVISSIEQVKTIA